MKLKCTHQFFSQIWINITKSFFKLSLYCEFPKSLYWNYTKPILSQFHFLESSFLEYKGWVFTPIKRYQYIINFTKAKNILLFGKMVTKRQLWILTRSLCVSNTFKIEYMNKFMVKRLLLLDHLRVYVDGLFLESSDGPTSYYNRHKSCIYHAPRLNGAGYSWYQDQWPCCCDQSHDSLGERFTCEMIMIF